MKKEVASEKTRSKPLRRQVFVLTFEEKKTIAFVLCALVLGLATKHYRDTHPRAPRQLSAKEQRAAKKAARLHAPASPSFTATPPRSK
jgi:hypothetical protein